MSFEIQRRLSVGRMPGQFYLLHHPVSFLYSFFQKTLMKKVKEKGQKVFLLVQSLFPVLSKQEAPHHTFKKTSDQYTCMIYNDTLTICYIKSFLFYKFMRWVLLLFPLYRWENWKSEKLSNLLEVW